MLAITRCINEEVAITDERGNRLLVAVHRVRGNKVTLTFNGPKCLRIHRAEVVDQPAKEKQVAQ